MAQKTASLRKWLSFGFVSDCCIIYGMGCSQSLDQPNKVEVGEYEKTNITLDSFRFERTLGKGGFGKVNAGMGAVVFYDGNHPGR